MGKAARVSFAEMSWLMGLMPTYQHYKTCHEAETAEKDFRQALGAMLKECGDHLLDVAERQNLLLNEEQEGVIDTLVDGISAIFRRLNREGIVALVGDCETTIAELEEIDTRLILLVEETLRLVRNLPLDVSYTNWFKKEAGLLSQDLVAFSEAAEARNYLLGLGWESEFSPPRREA
jgi:hypothetical protein